MKLLPRVFEIDVSVRRRCRGPMRIVRAVTDPDEIAAELHGARAPPRQTPRGQIVLFPTGCPEGTLRLSFGVFNDERDVDAVLETIDEYS
jgi:selenocysteine lyase/cysteine desulfurase